MKDSATDYLENWRKDKPDDVVYQWCFAMVNQDYNSAQGIEDRIRTEGGGTPWDPIYADPDFELVKAISKITK